MTIDRILTTDSFPRNYPNDNGVGGGKDLLVTCQSLTEAGTITGAELEYELNGDGVWLAVPDADSDEDIGVIVAASGKAGYIKSVAGGEGLRYRISCPSAPSVDFRYGFNRQYK